MSDGFVSLHEHDHELHPTCRVYPSATDYPEDKKSRVHAARLENSDRWKPGCRCVACPAWIGACGHVAIDMIP